MSDDRPFDRFHVLDGPIQPEGAFAERLFDALAADLGYRPERGLAGLRRRARRALGLERPPVGARALRLAYLAAILGLLVALAIGAALAAGQFLQRSAEDIVRASQALYRDGTVPAFTMTIRYRDASVDRFLWNGAGSLRIETVSGVGLGGLAAGSYVVSTPQGRGIFDAGADTWSQGSGPALWPLDGLPLFWIVPVPVPAGQAPPTYTCPAWLREADGTVAGRSVYHVTCGSVGFWIDTDTLVLLRRDDPQVDQLEVIGFEPGVSAPAEAFALVKPPGAFDPNNPPASTVLAVGRSAPRLTGTTLDGTAVDTSAQAGPLVVYFWAPWCDPCTGPQLSDLQTVATRHAPSVTTVTIATLDQLGSVTGYVNANGIRLPVVNDSGSLLKSWGISAIPALVMLDRSGAVAALRLGPVPASELEQMYAALAAGEPVPTPSATAVPSSEAPPTYAPGATETISGLAIGDLAPTWSGPLLNGGTLEGSSLVGKPTVIWFELNCADCPTTDLEAFEAAHRQVGSEANFVVVAGGEPTPGWTAALFQRLGITVPLVFDWDHRIPSAFKLNILGTIVLDASGRVAYVAPGAMSTEQILGLVRKLKPESTVPAP